MSGKSATKLVLMMSLVLLLVALPFITACAPKEEEVAPEREREVTIGVILPLTGPGATSAMPQLAGNRLCVDYLNEEKGGINGIRVKLLWADTGYELARAVSAYRRMVVAEEVKFQVGLATASGEALKEALAKDQVPSIQSSTSWGMFHPVGWIFGSAAYYPDNAAAGLKWWLENRWKGEGRPKMAFAGWDVPYGRAPLVGGTEEYARELGYDVHPFESIPLIPIDLTPQLTRMRDAGVDLVYLNAIESTVAAVMKGAKRLGLTDEMAFMTTWSGGGDGVIRMAGDAAEGYLWCSHTAWWDEEGVPGIELLKQLSIKYQKEVTKEENLIVGFLNMWIMCGGIKMALDEVGFDRLDGLAVRNAFETGKPIDCMDLAAPVVYTPEDHYGINSIKMFEARGGKMVQVSDWVKMPHVEPKE